MTNPNPDAKNVELTKWQAKLDSVVKNTKDVVAVISEVNIRTISKADLQLKLQEIEIVLEEDKKVLDAMIGVGVQKGVTANELQPIHDISDQVDAAMLICKEIRSIDEDMEKVRANTN